MLLLLVACSVPVVKSPAQETGSEESGSAQEDDTGGAETGSHESGGGDTDQPDSPADTSLPDAGLTLALDDEVVTIIHASWTDAGANDGWLEYRFETETWLTAPEITTESGVILGIPAETEVEVRVAEVLDGVTHYSDSATITTGELPAELLVPTIEDYDEALADTAPYAMISITVASYTYAPPFWLEIFDRQGRVVWYHEVPDNLMTFYPTPALDGTHIWYEAENIFYMSSATPHLTRMTLDGRWTSELDVPSLGQAATEGPDGSFFYEERGSGVKLNQISADGTRTTLWDAGAWMRTYGLSSYYALMNTLAWSEERNTIVASMFESDTAFEIDLDTLEPIRQMGQLTVGDPYAFSPSDSMFDYQHNPYWTEEGTLLVSTHKYGRSGVQVAAEYEVDDATKTLTLVWSYESSDIWATQIGEAIRLRNGNTIQGYGQDGAVREVTPDGTVVWQASWKKDGSGYRVIGHLSLIDDLYALNQGPAD